MGVSLCFCVSLTGPRITAFFTLLISVGLVLFASSRQHSGLPGPMSEAMLSDLRARLQSQGTIPELPGPWRSSRPCWPPAAPGSAATSSWPT